MMPLEHNNGVEFHIRGCCCCCGFVVAAVLVFGFSFTGPTMATITTEYSNKTLKYHIHKPLGHRFPLASHDGRNTPTNSTASRSLTHFVDPSLSSPSLPQSSLSHAHTLTRPVAQNALKPATLTDRYRHRQSRWKRPKAERAAPAAAPAVWEGSAVLLLQPNPHY